MLDSNQIKRLIKERSELHLNDPKVYEFWGKLTEILSANVLETIEFFDTCTEQEAYWLSEIFEDISARVNSQDFIECIKRVDRKYPELLLAKDIKVAEEFMAPNL
ncbi:hypothetical protein HPY28_04465 [Brevibacillus sp. HB1.2]|uniref:hypothetical protein n=1 Tax=Brevibacillus sp. HB1.2 TaxID=2738807 RepID=UPI001575185A|nr:hypothetical protein [Brevibacillus sp. HB1.2]NTU19573.1 hypothetical protein [Brevibacillus sp. HB1.2]